MKIRNALISLSFGERDIDESVFKAYVVEVHAYTGDVTFATTVDADTPVYLWQY